MARREVARSSLLLAYPCVLGWPGIPWTGVVRNNLASRHSHQVPRSPMSRLVCLGTECVAVARVSFV